MHPARPSKDPGRRRLRRLLSSFFLRFHMTLILVATFAAGALANHALFVAGLRSPIWRWPLGTVLAYAVFFVCVWLWLLYVRDSMTQRALQESEVLDLGLEMVSETGFATSGSGVDLSLDVDDLGGVVIVALIAVVVAIVGGCAVYLVWTGPALLTEAAFEMALAAGLIRPASRLYSPNWVSSIALGTATPFLLTLGVAIAGGWFVDGWCPTAERLADLTACW